MPDALPENTESRRKKRLRSGMCAAAAAAGVLLLLFLLYGVTGKILKNIAESRWQKLITAAIKSGDTEKTAALLEKCRQEAPYLQKKNIFKEWQKEYLRLADIEKIRRKEFRQRLAVLQEKLKNPPENAFAWTDELTSLASYASDEQELAQLRKLEEHCKALEKLHALKAAANGAKALETLENELGKLQQIYQQQEWLKFQKNSRALALELNAIILQYASVPEIGQKAMQIKKTLEQLQNTAHAAQTQAEAEKLHYSKLFTAVSEEELRSLIGDFLKRYPQSVYAPELKNTLDNLEILHHTYREQLDFIVQSMAKSKQYAYDVYRKELNKIIAGELKFGTFELILHTNDQRIIRFETLTRCFFTLQENGRYNIKFTDVNGKPVNGSFSADGSGEVACAGTVFQGKLAYGKVAGSLPESVKQHVLLKLQQLMQEYKNEAFPVFLYFVDQKMNSGKFNLLPGTVKEKLQAAVRVAEKNLNAAAVQFIFTEEIIKCCRDNTPVFAGIVKAEKNTLSLTPSAAALANNKSATLWVIDARNKHHFEVLGKLKNAQITQVEKQLPDNRKLYISAIPANGANYTGLLKKWQTNAARHQLQIPTLPDFLKEIKK